ncbi:galactokinase [Chitinophaga pendula]|uniref:galactokinase n=1 Tax=Chitinophaga TaxID=79328 RepID=UPI000BAEF8EC|nr:MULTISPECIES: galactokinase [Chitinophaga]ASZ11033.1 galactokinase [Chitinophaga sp. MD30]UCJ05970.1 galactokinase [Chitinophaga pendula]
MDLTTFNTLSKAYFDRLPLTVKAAGRINLIGEHTDYNNGFVLPAAIDKAVYLSIVQRDDNQIILHALDLDDHYQGNTNDLTPSGKHWPDYLLGVVQQLQNRGHAITGFECTFGGNIPQGAGLSSSAALECATAFALNELLQLDIDKIDLVKYAQAAENEFVGVRCGIMDQFASMFGKKNQLVKLDCGSLEYEYIPFRFDDVSLVLLDTRVKHSLASSEYNTRRAECEQGVAWIQPHHPAVKTLRDASLEMLDTYVKPNSQVVYNRCRYVVEEIQRLRDACEDLRNDNLDAFGQKMFATHEGLDKLYNVSCPELNWLVELVKDDPAVYGARMMGGGFGGCTINIVKKEAVPALLEKAKEGYAKQFNVALEAYVTSIENGCSLVQQEALVG